MRWIVGLDLRSASRNVLEAAAWLREVTGVDGLEAVHVVEEDALGVVLSRRSLPELVAMASQHLDSIIAEAGLGDLVRAQVVRNTSIDAGLQSLIRPDDVAGLIVGRRAATDEHRLVRLGGVVRSLLRTLPAPVVVIPPDVNQARLRSGPILALSDLTPSSTAAVRFAVDLGERSGRDVVVVHVVSLHEDDAVPYLSEEQLENVSSSHWERAQTELESWLSSHSFRATESEIVRGPPIACALACARERKASMIVCGSRRLTMGERIFSASAGSTLAASSACPVAVVPPSNGT